MAQQQTHLTEQDLAELRQALEDKKLELVSSLKHLRSDFEDQSETWSQEELSSVSTHPADEGTDMYQRELTLSMIARNQQRLDEVMQALERMNNGTYGICQGTGEPITIERLRAKPWARYSLEYAKVAQDGSDSGGSAPDF